MAYFSRIIILRKLRFALMSGVGAVVVGAAVLPGGAAFALTRVDLFDAVAPVSDRSEAAQTAAFQAALKIVLVRVTGRRSADEESVFAPLVGNARRYVQQYRSAPDGQLWVSFDAAAIERWLTQNGQPLWGRDRPSTFVWLSVAPESASGTPSGAPPPGPVVLADDTSELKDAIDAAAALRGVPLVWPSAAVANGGGAAAEAAHRVGADAVLIGRASNSTAAAAVRWTLQYQDRSSDMSGPLEGVNRAADLYAGLFAASGNLAPVDLEVSGVNDLHDYAGVQAYLESLTFISHVGVQALAADTVRFRVTTRGGAESLAHALAQNGKLVPLPAGEDGVQRYQIRR